MPWEFLDVRTVLSHCFTLLYQALPSTDIVCQRGIYPLGRIRGRSMSCALLGYGAI